MAKQEFLQLSHVYDPAKHKIKGWFASEKMDGQRAFWDGGVSRGLLTSDVPWANIEKDGRYKTPTKATGLWSRYGKPIQAPSWFLDSLPSHPADGELWSGPGRFQYTSSVIKQLIPDERWTHVQYKIFDIPTYRQVFSDRKLTGKYAKTFSGIMAWLKARGVVDQPTMQFIDIVAKYGSIMHEQRYFSDLETELTKVLANGGEGLILRNPYSIWTPERVYSSLKYKPFQDSEGIVVGYQWGRETDKGSKLLGLMGAMIVEWKGKQFKLSGFTDEERVMCGPDNSREGFADPGGTVSSSWTNPLFPRGASVTFSYRELSDDKIPKEARFLRKRED